MPSTGSSMALCTVSKCHCSVFIFDQHLFEPQRLHGENMLETSRLFCILTVCPSAVTLFLSTADLGRQHAGAGRQQSLILDLLLRNCRIQSQTEAMNLLHGNPCYSASSLRGADEIVAECPTGTYSTVSEAGNDVQGNADKYSCEPQRTCLTSL